MKNKICVAAFVIFVSCSMDKKTAYTESVSGCVADLALKEVSIRVSGVSVAGGQKKVFTDSAGCFQTSIFSYGVGSGDLPSEPELMGKAISVEYIDSLGHMRDASVKAISFKYLRKNEAVVRLPVVSLSP